MAPPSLALALALAAAGAGAARAATPFSARSRLFGTALKNAPIPAFPAEWEIYNHSCAAPPCVITQLHFPSIYPGGGDPWAWEQGVLRVYVDGDEPSAPSIALTLLQLAGVGAAGAKGDSHSDVSPFSAELFGKNAQTGGVWSTMRIPFQSSVRLTVQQAPSGVHQGTFWGIVRGVEALGITLSDMELPPAARLVQSTISGAVFQPQQFITLAQAPAAMDGLMLSVFLDATSVDPNYLEGCFHIVNGDDGAVTWLSSGTEDYFLSASYFDEGVFAGSQAGLTYRGAGGDLSCYKTHTRDLVPFHGGMQYIWRNNEDGKSCPNHWGSDAVPAAAAAPQPARIRGGLGTAPLNLTSIVFYYAWPAAAAAAAAETA